MTVDLYQHKILLIVFIFIFKLFCILKKLSAEKTCNKFKRIWYNIIKKRVFRLTTVSLVQNFEKG